MVAVAAELPCAAATTPVAREEAGVEPYRLDAVTTTRSLEPASRVTSRYVLR